MAFWHQQDESFWIVQEENGNKSCSENRDGRVRCVWNSAGALVRTAARIETRVMKWEAASSKLTKYIYIYINIKKISIRCWILMEFKSDESERCELWITLASSRHVRPVRTAVYSTNCKGGAGQKRGWRWRWGLDDRRVGSSTGGKFPLGAGFRLHIICAEGMCAKTWATSAFAPQSEIVWKFARPPASVCHALCGVRGICCALCRRRRPSSQCLWEVSSQMAEELRQPRGGTAPLWNVPEHLPASDGGECQGTSLWVGSEQVRGSDWWGVLHLSRQEIQATPALGYCEALRHPSLQRPSFTWFLGLGSQGRRHASEGPGVEPWISVSGCIRCFLMFDFPSNPLDHRWDRYDMIGLDWLDMFVYDWRCIFACIFAYVCAWYWLLHDIYIYILDIYIYIHIYIYICVCVCDIFIDILCERTRS